MNRTKKRALVTGTIPAKNALIFAAILGIFGLVILATLANLLTSAIALTGFVFYVLVYTPLKPRSVHATLAGSVAGAVPPVVGYCAATNQLDLAAGLLFLILVFWQMPHFYAIAMYRFNDYHFAGLPVLPVKKSHTWAKVAIILYILGFFIVTSLLYIFAIASYIYLFVMLAVSLGWFFMALQGFGARNDARWARGVFRFSLVVLLVFSLTISIDNLLT